MGPAALIADASYMVKLRCPSCGQSQLIAMNLVSRLDRTPAAAHLGLKVQADKVWHMCGQTQIDVPGEPGLFDGAGAVE